jgi:hypothetical protein
LGSGHVNGALEHLHAKLILITIDAELSLALGLEAGIAGLDLENLNVFRHDVERAVAVIQHQPVQ